MMCSGNVAVPMGLIPSVLPAPVRGARSVVGIRIAIILGSIPTRIRILQRIPPRIQEAVVVDRHSRVRHERVRRDERPQRRVVIARIVVQQPRPVLLLPRERPVRVQGSPRTALRAVGVGGVASPVAEVPAAQGLLPRQAGARDAAEQWVTPAV